MDPKALNQLNLENADVICARIRDESVAQQRQMLARATQQAQEIIALAQQKVQAQKVASVKASEDAIQKARERMLSVISLEKKRLILGQKDLFIRRVLEKVGAEAASFRSSDQYPLFLARAIREGVAVLGVDSVEVRYSYRDAHIMTDEFIAQALVGAGRLRSKDCTVRLRQDEYDDLGVIVNAADGRMLYDNRFTTRLERIKERVTMELMKQL